MSGILGQLAGAALQNMLGGGQQQGGAAGSPLTNILGQLLGGGGAIAGQQQSPGMTGGTMGGLGGLLSQLQQAGLGEQANSWVSKEQNMPVSPADLQRAISPEQINTWAQQAGTDPNSLLAVLSQALPQVIDQMTPDGQVPAQHTTAAPSQDQLSSLLSGLLGGQR